MRGHNPCVPYGVSLFGVIDMTVRGVVFNLQGGGGVCIHIDGATVVNVLVIVDATHRLSLIHI